MSLRKLDVTDYLFILFLIFVLAGYWSFLNHIIEQSSLDQAVVMLPDIRVIGKVTESIPVNNYTARLRLDDGTTLILETADAIPAGVTAVLRRTANQKDWLCLKALSTDNIKCYQLQGDLF
ncbi:hypothetical protein KG383_004445 [Salmonella enterica subsp. enterica serovar Newport]|nr:hypothetical protein [Salmonella enterica subsp. enterica serovar Newport]